MVPAAKLPQAAYPDFRLVGDLSITRSCEGRRNGDAVPAVALDQAAAAPKHAIITVERETPLRALIDARLMHPGPFVVREGDTFRGLICDEDLFRCLQPRPAEEAAKAS